MIKALAIKELRESLGITVVAALLMAWAVATTTGGNPLTRAFAVGYHSPSHIAFINGSFSQAAVMFVGGLAVLLGLKQSAWEEHHATLHFLYFRPISRRVILASKLAVGTTLVFGLMAVSILAYGTWAATPGNNAAPFEWSMSSDAWKLAASLPLIYLGGFLCGIRPGRWFGTRLVPFVGAVAWVTLATSFVTNLPAFWWLQWPLLILGYVGWLVAIDYYTQYRDY